MKRSFLLLSYLVLIFFFSSCAKEEQSPITAGAMVTVTNTLQTAADPSAGGTGGVEMPVEGLLGVAAGTFVLSAEVGDGIEFDDYLGGLYDIDISETAIKFTLVAAANHPTFSAFFRTIEPNTFDRYYLKFDSDQNITSATSNNSSVSLIIKSANEVVVEIGEGYDFNSGTTFTITL